MSETTENEPVPEPNVRPAALSRVLNLSIFFVGIGVFAAVGLALRRTALLGSLELTYFAVGGAVGIVGLLLWAVVR
jgi:hypothetical protein